jgi:hypothetical protein
VRSVTLTSMMFITRYAERKGHQGNREENSHDVENRSRTWSRRAYRVKSASLSLAPK